MSDLNLLTFFVLLAPKTCDPILDIVRLVWLARSSERTREKMVALCDQLADDTFCFETLPFEYSWTSTFMKNRHSDDESSTSSEASAGLQSDSGSEPGADGGERSKLFKNGRTLSAAVGCASTCPVVVHCSAGVGRAGTFIALASILEKYARTDASLPVDLQVISGKASEIVLHLRRHRCGIVQTVDQFKFMCQCAYEASRANLVHAFSKLCLYMPAAPEKRHLE